MASLLRPPSSDLVFSTVDTTLLHLLQQREEELDEFMRQMDDAQSEYDHIAATVSEKQIEFESKQRELERDHAVHVARELEGVSPHTDRHSISDSQFNQEQMTFLTEKRNEIGLLQSTLEKSEDRSTELETEVSFLCQHLTSLKSESADLAKRLQRSVCNRRKLEETAEFSRGQRKETGNQIRAYRKVAKDAENARAGLIARHESMAAVSDPVTGLPSVIHNINSELERINLEIAALDEQIGEYEEQSTEVKVPAPATSVRQQEKSAEWMQGMDEDLEAAQEEIALKNTELENELRRVNQLENRYRKLQPIAVAWKKRLSFEPDREELGEVDDLLKQVPKAEGPADDSRKAELEALVVINAELDVQIAKLKRELSQNLQQLTIKEAKLKTQISDQRKGSSAKEKAIVDEIRDLRLKLAQRSLK